MAKVKLADYERPTRVEFVNEFPLNSTGKILRPKLRELLIERTVEVVGL